MHFACSRCAHRQAEDTQCAGCGNDVVQDMRDPAGRRVLYEAEARWLSARDRRSFAVGFAVCFLAFLVVGELVGFMLFDSDPSVRAALRPSVAGLSRIAIQVLFGAAILVPVLVAGRRNRRKFPYLDVYAGERPLARPPFR